MWNFTAHLQGTRFSSSFNYLFLHQCNISAICQQRCLVVDKTWSCFHRKLLIVGPDDKILINVFLQSHQFRDIRSTKCVLASPEKAFVMASTRLCIRKNLTKCREGRLKQNIPSDFSFVYFWQTGIYLNLLFPVKEFTVKI